MQELEVEPLKKPAPHGVHVVEESWLYDPGEQGMHADASRDVSDEVRRFPAAHGVQDAEEAPL